MKMDEEKIAELMAPICEGYCLCPGCFCSQEALDAACERCYIERLVRSLLSGGELDDLA